MKKWFLYLLILGFAAYWASNLILWFPWSYSAALGMTLMLTVTPVLWAYITFMALKTYPKEELLKSSLIIAFVFLFLAALMDYIFFGLIRNAMEDLYHPTTFYGYAFLVCWPLILAFILKKKIQTRKKKLSNVNMLKAGLIGIGCFLALTLIIVLKIEI